MIWFLRILFIVVIGSMLGLTFWASLSQPLGEFARGPVMRDPWVIATLADAYWAFITFFVWVAWKETSWVARVLWFIAIIALGNLAMATYMLVELFRVSSSAPLSEVFAVRRPSRLTLPAILVALSVGIYLLA